MDQDPFAGTGQNAGQSYDYGSGSQSQNEAASANRYAGSGSSEVPAGQEAGEIGHVRSFLEDQLRERPLPTLLLGVLAGWIAGKLLR